MKKQIIISSTIVLCFIMLSVSNVDGFYFIENTYIGQILLNHATTETNNLHSEMIMDPDGDLHIVYMKKETIDNSYLGYPDTDIEYNIYYEELDGTTKLPKCSIYIDPRPDDIQALPAIELDEFGDSHIVWMDYRHSIDHGNKIEYISEIYYCSIQDETGTIINQPRMISGLGKPNAPTQSDGYNSGRWNRIPDLYDYTSIDFQQPFKYTKPFWIDGYSDKDEQDFGHIYYNQDDGEYEYWHVGYMGPDLIIDNLHQVHIVWEDEYNPWYLNSHPSALGPNYPVIMYQKQFIDGVVLVDDYWVTHHWFDGPSNVIYRKCSGVVIDLGKTWWGEGIVNIMYSMGEPYGSSTLNEYDVDWNNDGTTDINGPTGLFIKQLILDMGDPRDLPNYDSAFQSTTNIPPGVGFNPFYTYSATRDDPFLNLINNGVITDKLVWACEWMETYHVSISSTVDIQRNKDLVPIVFDMETDWDGRIHIVFEDNRTDDTNPNSIDPYLTRKSPLYPIKTEIISILLAPDANTFASLGDPLQPSSQNKWKIMSYCPSLAGWDYDSTYPNLFTSRYDPTGDLLDDENYFSMVVWQDWYGSFFNDYPAGNNKNLRMLGFDLFDNRYHYSDVFPYGPCGTNGPMYPNRITTSPITYRSADPYWTISNQYNYCNGHLYDVLNPTVTYYEYQGCPKMDRLFPGRISFTSLKVYEDTPSVTFKSTYDVHVTENIEYHSNPIDYDVDYTAMKPFQITFL